MVHWYHVYIGEKLFLKLVKDNKKRFWGIGLDKLVLDTAKAGWGVYNANCYSSDYKEYIK